MKVLMDLHHAFSGYAGLQQEIRLLFKMLAQVDNVQLSGLVLSPSWSTRDVPLRQKDGDPAVYYERLSNFIAALEENVSSKQRVRGHLARIRTYMEMAACALTVLLKSSVGRSFPLFEIDSTKYGDFLWQKLFSPSLSDEDWGRIAGQRFLGTSLGRHFMHGVGMCGLPYPQLDTRGVDVFIAHTAFPCRLSTGTQLLIRHQDAIPLTHPDYNPNRRDLFITYYLPLRFNVKKAGAIFVCNSGPTREDLVRLFPEADAKSVIIPCVISDRFYKIDNGDVVPEIIRTRSYSPSRPGGMIALPYRSRSSASDYILAVARLEPRKNYLTVLKAWEQYRFKTGRDLKLVAVAAKGGQPQAIRQAMERHLARGDLFLLENVPVEELRILYSSAKAALSASYAEGFDMPGIEAMLCESPVIASDIRTHRWVYGDAALYFNPDSAASLCNALEQLLHSDQAIRLRHELTRRGLEIAHRYQEDAVRPMWEDLLEKVVNRKHVGQPGRAATQLPRGGDDAARVRESKGAPLP